MAKVKCSCGNVYDDTFKFCPECATPNPKIKKKEQNSEPVKKKGKFKMVEVSTLDVDDEPENKPKKSINKMPVADIDEDTYEDYEDEDKEVLEVTDSEYAEEDDINIDDYEFDDEDDDETSVEYDYEDEDEDEEEYNEDEDEDEEEVEEIPVPVITKKSSKPSLKAPSTQITKATKTVKKAPKSDKIKTVKSSLKKNYDPNADGYYDDRLPALLDEVTKTTHIDVILKISLSFVGVAALIVYCIFYLQV